MQFMWLKVGRLFVYTEAAGPVLHLFGRQLPLYMVIYDSVLFAIVALLCVRDDDDSGRPAILTKIARSLPGLRARITTTRLMVIATAVLMSARGDSKNLVTLSHLLIPHAPLGPMV